MAAEFDARGRLELIGDGEWVAADLSVRAEGEPGLSFRLRPPAQLRMDDGSVVALDLAGAALLGGVEETSRGRWPELEKGPLGIAARDYRPGPHVPLVVKLRGVRSGALVTVRGAERVRSSAQGSSYREAELERTVQVREIEARGRRETPSSPARPPDAESITWALALLTALVCASLQWWAALGAGDTSSVWVAAACSAFAGTLVWRVSARWRGHWHFIDHRAPSYRWLPQPVSIEHGQPQKYVHYGNRSIPPLVALPTLIFLLPLTAVRVTGPPATEKDTMFMAMAGGLALLATLVLLVEDHHRVRSARRFTRALATASSSPGWTVTNGPLNGALTRVVTMVTPIARRPPTHVADSVTAPDRVEVGAATISTRGVEWAAQCWESDLTKDPKAARHTLRYSAQDGAQAIAIWAGDPNAEGVWEVTGPGSLLLFTGSGDPVSALRRALLVQSLGPVPLLLSIAAALLVS